MKLKVQQPMTKRRRNAGAVALGFLVCVITIGTQLFEYRTMDVFQRPILSEGHLHLPPVTSTPKSSVGLPPSFQESSHWCHSRDFLADNYQRATCMFQNFCVVPRKPTEEQPQEVEFVYLSNSDVVDTKEMEFTLGVSYHSVDDRIRFTPKVMTLADFQKNNPTPIRYIPGISPILYEFNSENFGHMLTDVLMPMYVALDSFSMTTRQDVQLFRLYIQDAIGWSCDLQKITDVKVINNTQAAINCERMYQLFSQLTPGHTPLQVLNATSMAPTCFQSAIVGMVHFGDDCDNGDHGREQNYWSLCNVARQNQFWNFRNWMLENAGVSSSPPSKHKITITNTKGGIVKRNLPNLQEFISKVRQKYPNIEVVVAEWDKMPLHEQLELIRTTTVHVTPPGGVSFISMFLPRWATSVRLYSKDWRMEWHLFRFLGYMTIEDVDCRSSAGRIPIDEAMEAVEKSLRRYETFRTSQDPIGWIINQQ